jgi:serine/threonine-protein kinase
METSQTGPCEALLWDLHRSNLIDRGQLDQLVADLFAENPSAPPETLIERLIERGLLSSFQAERLLANKGQELVLNNYVLVDQLGQGSMGSVFKAISKTDEKYYAIKLLPRRSMWNVRLARRLVRALEQVRDPSYVPFIDVGTAGNTHLLVWELAEGEPLNVRVQRLGRLLPGIAALYCMHVAQGLAIFEKQGAVHGIIKPSNIMITDAHQARILDFGIGALLSEAKEESLVDTMSTSNTVTAGLDFRSPETILEPTLRTAAGDQYSLGCMLYYCLTGQLPFPEGSAVQKMMAHQSQEPTPVRKLAPATPKRLALVVERMMKKKPEERFPTPDSVVEALQPLTVSPEMAARLIATNAQPEPVDSSADVVLNEQQMAALRSTPLKSRTPPQVQNNGAAPAPVAQRRPPSGQHPALRHRVPAPAPEPQYTEQPANQAYGAEPVADAGYAQPVESAEAGYGAEPVADAGYNAEPVTTMPRRRPVGRLKGRRAQKQAARTPFALLLLMGLLGFVLGFAVVGGAMWYLLH